MRFAPIIAAVAALTSGVFAGDEYDETTVCTTTTTVTHTVESCAPTVSDCPYRNSTIMIYPTANATATMVPYPTTTPYTTTTTPYTSVLATYAKPSVSPTTKVVVTSGAGSVFQSGVLLSAVAVGLVALF